MSTLAAGHAAQNSPSRPSPSISNGSESGRNVSAGARSERISVSVVRLDPESTVTPRQLELLALYASGYSYEDIGRMRFFSPTTVKYHLYRAVARSGARNLTHLCAALADVGMIRRNADQIYEPVADLRIAGE